VPAKRRLKFDFDVINVVDKDTTKSNKEWLSLVGNILLDILVETAKISNPRDKGADEKVFSVTGVTGVAVSTEA
jgi:hypothetical protein